MFLTAGIPSATGLIDNLRLMVHRIGDLKIECLTALYHFRKIICRHWLIPSNIQSSIIRYRHIQFVFFHLGGDICAIQQHLLQSPIFLRFKTQMGGFARYQLDTSAILYRFIIRIDGATIIDCIIDMGIEGKFLQRHIGSNSEDMLECAPSFMRFIGIHRS